MSAKDGSVVRNLTPGFDMDRGFEYIATPSLSNMVPWMSWSPQGDRIAYFVRTEKHKTLILHNAVTGKIDRRVELRNVDMPESPDISPDGRTVAFSALSGAIGDIFVVDLKAKKPAPKLVTKHKGMVQNHSHTFTADGKKLVYGPVPVRTGRNGAHSFVEVEDEEGGK